MNSSFAIAVDWLSGVDGPVESRETSAFIGIYLKGLVATRAEDEWSKSVRNNVRLSAYPLATWFAASWWRLRWEPSYAKKSRGNHSWRMAHELPAAGNGFVWPKVIFESDGEAVDVTCVASPSLQASIEAEPIRYLNAFSSTITASSFEETIDHFVSLVLARLEAVGAGHTALHKLWKEIGEERANEESSIHRRLEARLGFDPDEASPDLMQQFLSLVPKVGRDAVAEVAPACAGEDPKGAIAGIVELAKLPGVDGKIAAGIISDVAVDDQVLPWRRGWQLARAVRTKCGLNGNELSDGTLADLLGISSESLEHHHEPAKPLGMVVRNGAGAKLIFRRRNHRGRRFEAARFLGDSLLSPMNEKWLPTTDAKTVRQKTQRAFAAELLCPIDSLIGILGDDYSDGAISEAAEYFDISPLAVLSHLANNGLIEAEQVPNPTYGDV